MRALGVHPFVAEKTAQQAARFSIESLESIYRKLLKINEGVETSHIALDLTLDTAVVELTNCPITQLMADGLFQMNFLFFQLKDFRVENNP